MWYIYLLYSPEHKRTYVGSTTDPARRLRQHNGELKGGARATRGKQWKLLCYVGGFKSRSAACRWEKLVKVRSTGQENRMRAMVGLVGGLCPPGRREYPVPEGLFLVRGDADVHRMQRNNNSTDPR